MSDEIVMPQVVPQGTDRVNPFQVPIDLSPRKAALVMTCAMEKTFGEALIWHMERHHTGVSDLARSAGVSPDVIKKMRTRPGSTTTAENAVAIARYYGQSVSEFLECREEVLIDKLSHMIDLLTREERELLECQVAGLIQSRAHK